MFLSTSTIDDKTINLLFTRIITNHNSLQKHGSIALSEFNIDEITSLSNYPYCRKEILVKINI